jgi:hypothetical protein
VAKLGPDIKAKIGQQLRLSEFRRALKMLSREQRESLILVGASGFHMKRPPRFAGARSAPSRAE